ncbi:ABC transporter substrate-binding protein [Trinickia mobilis]|uniref:ABC transporter substrate-binding protein n=1 Tax=Trinickia mobilis TaxID=2816356 RepID=UPI001A8D272B|nr:ABC transporter substrate-binding protein [Trinickia mobilis]
MDNTRRKFIKQAGCLSLASSLAAFPALSRASTTVAYGGSSWLGHYSAYLAMKSGIFSTLGIDLKWQSFGTSSARMGALMAGNLDVGGTGVVSALALMADGARQFQLISTPDSYSRSEGLLVHDNVNSLADLKGKKIGVTYASSSHVLLLDVLKQAGIAQSALTIINLPAPELLSAYEGKQIDAAVAWTPTFDKIRALPDTKLLLDDTAFSLYKQFQIAPGPDVLFVRTAFGKENPEATKNFLKGIGQANDMLVQKPEESAKLLMSLTNLTYDEQLAVVKQTQWYAPSKQKAMFSLGADGQPSSFIAGLQKLADMLVTLKQIDSAPRVQEWVQASYF